jgi:hypothetical protein
VIAEVFDGTAVGVGSAVGLNTTVGEAT